MTIADGRVAIRASDALVIGVDIGTTNSKAVACRLDGRIVAEARMEHAVSSPQAGWFEHDAEAVWWGDTVALCRRLMAEIGREAPIRGLAITTCGPCLVPVGADGLALRAGILYGVDTRATAIAQAFEGTIGRRAIRALSGMDLTSQSVGPKIGWVWRHEPDVARQAVLWHTATSFVVARLTGIAVIDHHQASYMAPFIDARRRRWDLRHAAGLALDGRLPALAWPGEIAGPLTAVAAAATGLPAGIPVLVGTSDGPTEALGVGAERPGVVAATYGSTTTLTTFADPTRPARGLWATAGWDVDQRCLAGGLSASGAIVDWLRRELALEMPGDTPTDVVAAHDALAAAAAASPPGARGLLVLPYPSGERTPFDDPLARGVVVGLTLQHTRADLHRAILEGIAFGVRHLLETFAAVGVPVDTIRAAGGGTASPLGPQIVSDVTGRAQAVAASSIGASYGAAHLAARAIGQDHGATPDANSGDDGDGWFRAERTVRPDPQLADTYDRGYALFRRLYRDTRPVVHALAEAVIAEAALAAPAPPGGVP